MTIEVERYENEGAEDSYDANWLSCAVRLDLGAFRGDAGASFRTTDFARFLAELDAALDGKARAATFKTMEDALSMRIELDRAGRAVVAGTLHESAGSATALSFEFESDQSHLAATRDQLRKVVSEFPEKHPP